MSERDDARGAALLEEGEELVVGVENGGTGAGEARQELRLRFRDRLAAAEQLQM
jgi:hypothetical protein